MKLSIAMTVFVALCFAAMQTATAMSLRQKETPIPTVRHQKKANAGYEKGSPLYAKQEALQAYNAQKSGDLDLTIPKIPIPGDVLLPPLKANIAPIFPVPTTSRCVVIICIQYMLIFTALAVLKTAQDLTSFSNTKLETGLKAAAQTVAYGPMLCVLFIACRMRVEFLSGGKDQPQMWVQHCMYGTTLAVLASTLVVLIIPLVTGHPLALKKGTCDLERPSGGGRTFYILSGVRYLIQLGLYGGIAGVIVGICTYLPPGHDDLTKLPAPAPAVMCTMILAVIFFLTQLVIAGAGTYSELTGKLHSEMNKITEVMTAAADTASFAPMLAILFLAARMRALQHDGQPQAWAQSCMYAATLSLAVTVCMAIAVPLAMGGKLERDTVTGQTKFEVRNQTVGYVLLGARYLTMLATYVGATGVIMSIFNFEAPAGPEHTLPVSPTVQCVVNLSVLYFFTYLVLNVMRTVTDVSGGSYARILPAIDAAKPTLAFAPMLSILFVTTRMYALLLTDKKGAPQAWVQHGMYMATWSLMISFFERLASGLYMGKVELDEDGMVVNKFSNKKVTIFVTVIRYLAMILLYGGIVTVIVGLFVMTPETANGRGSIPLVTDVVSQTPIGAPPPGINSVAPTNSSSLF